MSKDNNSAPMFRVGQKVVCVDDRDTPAYSSTAIYRNFIGGMNGLQEGRVYTVRALGEWPAAPGTTGVWLVEIIRPITSHAAEEFGEPPYAAARFRPAIERKTDISVFTAMLNPSRKEVTV